MTTQGTFIPQSQHDILVEAIKIKEHGGLVHGLGEGINLILWFGISIKSTHMQKKEMDELIEKKLASEHELEKKEFEDLEVVYKKKLEDSIAHELQICKKEMVELIKVCENRVLSR